MGVAGVGTLFRRGRVWWLDLAVEGKRYRISTRCVRREDAEKFRAERILEAGKGLLAGLRTKTTFEDLAIILENRYRAEGKPDLRLKYPLKHLRAVLGHLPVSQLTTDRITAYALARKATGAAVATVNLELAYLHRAFALGVEVGRIDVAPVIRALSGANKRRGFIEAAGFEAVIAELPEYLQAPAEFLYLTGWRLNEGLGLEWRRVNLAAFEIRLETSKTGAPRMLSFRGYEPLVGLLTRQKARVGPISPWVFPNPRGRQIAKSTIQSAWTRAREKAGETAMLHDLRRSMVRRMDRAGVPMPVGMTITGHSSPKMYLQYRSVPAQDQEEGFRRLQAATVESVVVKMPRAEEKS